MITPSAAPSVSATASPSSRVVTRYGTAWTGTIAPRLAPKPWATWIGSPAAAKRRDVRSPLVHRQVHRHLERRAALASDLLALRVEFDEIVHGRHEPKGL